MQIETCVEKSDRSMIGLKTMPGIVERFGNILSLDSSYL